MDDDKEDYEAIRQRNIRENAELMLSLGLDKSATRLRPASPERKPPVPRKRRASPPTDSDASSSVLPVRKSSRIASAVKPSYKDRARYIRAPEERPIREKKFREGTRRSNRASTSNTRPGGGKYKDWDTDDDAYQSDDYLPQKASDRTDDEDEDDKVFDLEYRQRRDRSETFVEIPSSGHGARLNKLKNPSLPTPPPEHDGQAVISSVRAALPEREDLPHGKGKGALLFEKGYEHFRPNVTPEEILRGGAFGGTAFREYKSSVLGRELDVEAELAELPTSWLEGLDVNKMLRGSTLDISKNRYGAKAGQPLEEWEKQGWISRQDPRGWWQWYVRFYLGRRSQDDARQIKRWLNACGPAGRFRKKLAHNVAKAGADWADERVSPAVRQTLWQWGYQLTHDDYRAYLRD